MPALAGAEVAPRHRAALALGVNRIRIGRVNAADEPVAAVDINPIVVDDAATRRESGPAPTAVVLQAAINLVVRPRIADDVVELAQGHEIMMVPMFAAIVGDVKSAVRADDHVASVARIDPQGMVIGMHAPILARLKLLAAIGGVGESDAADIEQLVVRRIDAKKREVHRPRIEAVDALPGVAGVVAAINAAGLPAILALLLLGVFALPAQLRGVRLGRVAAALAAATTAAKTTPFLERDGEFFLFLAAQDAELDLVANLAIAHLNHERAKFADRLAVDVHDDIVQFQPGLDGGAVVRQRVTFTPLSSSSPKNPAVTNVRPPPKPPRPPPSCGRRARSA